MIRLALVMIRDRSVQALIVFGLAAVAVAAAVAAPVYVRVAESFVVADDVASAPVQQRTMTVTTLIRLRNEDAGGPGQSLATISGPSQFETTAPSAMAADGFATAFSVRYKAFVATRPVQRQDLWDAAVEFREGFCERIVMIAGRCVSARGEAIVSEARVGRGLGVGATAFTTPARHRPGGLGEPDFYVADAGSARVAVVGVYRAIDPTDPYWGESGEDLRRPGFEPVLVDRATLAASDHAEESQSVVAYPLAGTFGVDRLDSVRQTLAQTTQAALPNLTVASGIESLLERIEQDRRTVAAVPMLAALPLVTLCWFVLFLAIANTVQARRAELGIVKLRGLSWGDQSWLAAAESVIPVLVGGTAGFFLGHVGVWAYGSASLGRKVPWSVTAPLAHLTPLVYAGVAIAGAIVAGVVALRSDLVASASDLLRRVPGVRSPWRAVAPVALVCALAVVAVIQLRANPVDQGGLARLAPALSIIALGLLFAAILDPALGRLGPGALRKGRLGLALAALHVGRRRGGARLVAIVVVAVGLVTFAVTAATAAEGVRERQVGIRVGADRVLTASRVDPAALLRVVREVDPDAAYAMAVIPVQTLSDKQPLLAVDSARLPSAANWPDENTLTAVEAARALRPAVDEPLILRGQNVRVAVDTTLYDARPADMISLTVTVAPLDGTPSRTSSFPPLRPGRHTYETYVGCLAGCRLVEVSVAHGGLADFGGLGFTLESVSQREPDAAVADAADLTGWLNRSRGGLLTEPAEAGLRVRTLTFVPGLNLAPPDTPANQPMIDAGGTPIYSLQLADNQRIAGAQVGSVAALPRLERVGIFTDLEYLLRVGRIITAGRDGEIWLGPHAPPDAASRFAAAGLTISSERRLSDEIARAAQGPSAVGLRFLLIAAVLSLLLCGMGLAVAAGVERRARADELGALRSQGLSRRHTMQAALIGYVVVVGAAAVLGGVVAVAVWIATGAYLPLSDAGVAESSLPRLPGAEATVAWGIGSTALAIVACLLAIGLTRAANRSGGARRPSR